MDSITQAALGAAIGEACLGKKIGNKGALLGAAVATIPDLDVFVLPLFSDLQRISVHRGYSHSIVVCLLLAVLLSVLMTKIKWTKVIAFQKLFLFASLTLITHVVLDAFTSYGTQLFLPFSDARVSFDSINVVDPVYTLPLLIGLFFSLYWYKNSNQRPRYNYIGLAVSTVYLLATLGVKYQVQTQFQNALAKEGVQYEKLATFPVGVASINWYGVAKSNQGIYLAKYADIKEKKEPFTFFPTNDFLLNDLDPYLVDRMKWMAKDLYVVAKAEDYIRFYNLQCDMQGIRVENGQKAPTAWYFKLIPKPQGVFEISTGMHPNN